MKKILLSLAVFGIAMGFLEAVVVAYLRQIYYPGGFVFPLKTMTLGAFTLESWREVSTIVMLLSIAIIAGKACSERISYFLYCFGIWDIFYYIWLKVLLDWPQSLLTWDILFLIPVVWAGPVLAPALCSLTMIALSLFILFLQKEGYTVRIHFREWVLMVSGFSAILFTFIWEYTRLIFQSGFVSHLSSLGTNPSFQDRIANHIPDSFNWMLFLSGEVFILSAAVSFGKRIRSVRSKGT